MDWASWLRRTRALTRGRNLRFENQSHTPPENDPRKSIDPSISTAQGGVNAPVITDYFFAWPVGKAESPRTMIDGALYHSLRTILGSALNRKNLTTKQVTKIAQHP